MNYEFILNDIRPSKEERETLSAITEKVISFINKTCKEESIPAKAKAVGSVAKDTWLSGNSDIDIFIHFPLEMPIEELKEKGLYLAYKASDALDGIPSEHYASHPYLTSLIDGIEVDIVPCYYIEDGSQLKSAVDRTILHTNYIISHLDEGQEDDVRLLKKFMHSIGTYGSEFKTGGFAGYLCELFILEYGTFENTLRQAQSWNLSTVLDLENHGNPKNPLFKDAPLRVIDPTDKNRNVAAALRLNRYVDFIISSRNFIKLLDCDDLDDDEKKSKVSKFFNPLQKERFSNRSNEDIAIDLLEEFKDRETKTLVLKVPIPEVSADALHPQLLKTVESIVEKLEEEGYSVFAFNYWTDEKSYVFFTIELEVFKLSKYYIHEGPKVWNSMACNNFSKKWSANTYGHDEFFVIKRERLFNTAEGMIKYLLTEKNIKFIRVGKNIKDALCNSYELFEIEDVLGNLNGMFDFADADKIKSLQFDYMNSLDDLLNPGQYIQR